MIIQINATVCAAVDHGEGRQHKIAGSDKRRMVQEGQGRGSYQVEQRIKERGRSAGSCSRCRMAWPRGHHRCASSREPGDLGSSEAACANRDRLLLHRLSYGQPGFSGGETRGLLYAHLFRRDWWASHSLVEVYRLARAGIDEADRL